MPEPASSPGSADIDQIERLLDAIVSIGSELDLPTMLRRIIEAATELVDARYGALGVLDESRTRLAEFITVGADEAVIERIGHYPEGHGILGLLIVEPEAIRLTNLRDHPDSYGFPEGHPPMTTFLGMPVRVRGEVFGNLYLTDKRNGEPFTDLDERLVAGFATAAGVAVEHARLHEQVAVLGVLADRERIARDLHDTVIQRIFATGLALQSAAVRTQDPQIVARLQTAIDDLDETVRHIRTTIFELQARRLPGRSIRQELLELVAEAAESLGFDPVVRFEGPVDLAVSSEIAEHLLAVAREALANVVKHAGTRELAVDLRVKGGDLTLELCDRGVGLPEERREGGHGIANLDARARELGGRLSLTNRPGGGAAMSWVVPLTQD